VSPRFRFALKVITASVSVILSALPLFFKINIPAHLKSDIQFGLQLTALITVLYIHPPRKRARKPKPKQ